MFLPLDKNLKSPSNKWCFYFFVISEVSKSMVGRADDVKNRIFCLFVQGFFFFETMKAILMLWSGQMYLLSLSGQGKLKILQFHLCLPALASSMRMYHSMRTEMCGSGNRPFWSSVFTHQGVMLLRWKLVGEKSVCLHSKADIITFAGKPYAYIAYTRSGSMWNKIERGITKMCWPWWILGKSTATEQLGVKSLRWASIGNGPGT